MPEIFAAFRRAYPEITLDVLVSNQQLNLSKRDADIAIRATEKPPEALVGRRLAGFAWAVHGPAAMASKSFTIATTCSVDVGNTTTSGVRFSTV